MKLQIFSNWKEWPHTLSLENTAELHSFTSATNYTPNKTSAGIHNFHSYLGSAHLNDFFGKELWFKLIAHQHFKMLFIEKYLF